MTRVSSFSQDPELLTPESLAMEARDEVESIHLVRDAYVCLEKLIEPIYKTEPEQVAPTRAELSALLGLVNEELRRRIDVASGAVQSLRAAMSGPNTAIETAGVQDRTQVAVDA